jgi:hypothetical protein
MVDFLKNRRLIAVSTASCVTASVRPDDVPTPTARRGYTTRERVVERALVRAVEQRGGLCMKFVSPGRRGVPDRIVHLPGAPGAYVEVKRPGEVPSQLQRYRMAEMRAAGALVHTLSAIDAIGPLLAAIQGGAQGSEGSR